MGSKRSFEGQEPLQLPYKFSKQSVSDEKLISFDDEKLAPIVCTLPGIEKPGPLVDPTEVKSPQKVHTTVNKALADGIHLPCHGGDTAWYRDFQRSFLPYYFIDSGYPGRAPVKEGCALSSFLNRYPRKPVPLGDHHQADLPKRKYPKPSRSHVSDITEKDKIVMGTCVIPMPDSSLPAQLPTGTGRKDCNCIDRASIRCVRQHVKEARDKLVKALGDETFRDLGFLEMGEEVANKWSEEEEQVFHAIVFSNPASGGKDFWPCLFEEFPTRSLKDIVSYYFNVFILRNRAAQNRSRFLDIDSDDDEWHPGDAHCYDLDIAAENDDNYSLDEDDNTSADDNEKDSSELHIKSMHKNNDTAQENGSCISFEYHSSINDSSPKKDEVLTREINRLRNNNMNVSSYQTETHNKQNQGCLVDSSNFRQWDQGFPDRFDHLIPTQNMIEEIFGPGSWDYKPYHD